MEGMDIERVFADADLLPVGKDINEKGGLPAVFLDRLFNGGAVSPSIGLLLEPLRVLGKRKQPVDLPDKTPVIHATNGAPKVAHVARVLDEIAPPRRFVHPT